MKVDRTIAHVISLPRKKEQAGSWGRLILQTDGTMDDFEALQGKIHKLLMKEINRVVKSKDDDNEFNLWPSWMGSVVALRMFAPLPQDVKGKVKGWYQAQIKAMKAAVADKEMDKRNLDAFSKRFKDQTNLLLSSKPVTIKMFGGAPEQMAGHPDKEVEE